MKLPIAKANNLSSPTSGFGFAFIDSEDKKLKIKKYDNTIIEFSNDLSDVELLNLIDCTAFEVFAHSYAIPVGECKELGGYVNYEIPASTIEKFKIRSATNNNDQDVFVDWGDGIITKLSDIIPINANSYNYPYEYILEHDYSSNLIENDLTNKKYIIKIFGTKYNSIIGGDIVNDYDGQYNLMSRIFDEDLPVASHLTNFSSFAICARRLLYVNATYSNFTHQVIQCPSLLRNCVNLIEAKGFNNCANIFECNSMFLNDFSLKNTDFFFKNSSIDNVSIHSCFYGCSNLEKDINDFFPTGGLIGNIKTTNIFRNCLKIYGTIPKHILWEDKRVNWDINDKNMFLGCSTEIRSQAPTSWGGSNKNLDIALSIKDPNYYSAIEVYPTFDVISAGFSPELNDDVTVEIPARNLQNITLRTYIPYDKKEDSDIIIDWGDGVYSTLVNSANVVDTQINSSKEVNYIFSHAYTEQKKYIIKIYGKDYFGFKCSYIKEGTTTITSNSQICRIFDDDLPIAPHVKDLSYVCYASNKLLNVNASNNTKFTLDNATAMFRDSRNLLSVNFSNLKCLSSRRSLMFHHCYNLKNSNVTIPINFGECESMYRVCRNLSADIASLLKNDIDNVYNLNVDMKDVLLNCSSIYGTIDGNMLWNNKNIKWLNTETCLSGCSSDIKSQVPISWGGTALDNIIEKSLEEKYNDLLIRIEALENK